MLVLSRKKNESVVIDGGITITVVEVRGDKVRLGIVAPRDVPVHRKEVWDLIHPESAAAPPLVDGDSTDIAPGNDKPKPPTVS